VTCLSFDPCIAGRGASTRAWLVFRPASVSPTHCVSSPSSSPRVALRCVLAVSIAACSLGAASTCLDLSAAYIKTRKQFGKPLAANQALQFKVADMATKLTSSRLMVHHAARLLDAKDPHAALHCAMAKKLATDNGFDIVNDALQLHGGYGYLADYPVERFLRDVRVHQILEGTNQIMDVIAARALLADD